MKKKILFVLATLNRGGAEKSLISLLKMLDYDKYDVDLLLFDRGYDLEKEIPNNVNVISDRKLVFLTTFSKKKMIKNFTVKGLFLKCKYLFAKNKNLSNYEQNQEKWKKTYVPLIDILKKEYDVAIGYMHSTPSYYVIDKVRATKKILWVHNDYEQLKNGQKFDNYYYDCADEIVTISESCLESLKKYFKNNIKKMHCIYNLNPEFEIRKKANDFYPEEYISSEKIVRLLSIGRLSNQKGFDIAIRAAYILKKNNLKFKWFIIGEGELLEKLNKDINELGLDNYVFLIGGRNNPYPYIKNADLVVQTSRYEGKSIVLDEAKILCKPIVVTNYNSINDQITKDITGLIVNIHEEDIATGIMTIINNKEYRDKLVNNLEKIKENSQEEIKKYYNLFDK